MHASIARTRLNIAAHCTCVANEALSRGKVIAAHFTFYRNNIYASFYRSQLILKRVRSFYIHDQSNMKLNKLYIYTCDIYRVQN